MDAESLAQIEQIVSGTEGRLHNEMQSLGTSLREEFEVKLNEKFEEAERHSGVLFEEMGRRLDLVIEGFEGLREQFKNLDAKIEHESLETRALIQLSYRQLQQRVEILEEKIQIIEKHLGLSA